MENNQESPDVQVSVFVLNASTWSVISSYKKNFEKQQQQTLINCLKLVYYVIS